MEETGKIDYKFKIKNPIEADKNPIDVHQEIVSFDNENSINDSYGNILSNQSFTDESINSKDPDKTASDNEIIL